MRDSVLFFETVNYLLVSLFGKYLVNNRLNADKTKEMAAFISLFRRFCITFAAKAKASTIMIQPNYPSVLLIYTGGTIGMIENPETGALEAFNFDQLQENVPELRRFNYRISSYQFTPPIDSSDMEPALWAKLVKIIEYNYDSFDGFVILHGTDTMAYTASALSFMLENLSKPVILTGSQLPIGVLRTDGKENLITSIEIAAAKYPDGRAVVPEVCIFFENLLLRGNRTTKINAENFNAFRSFNYPPLATVGIHIKYDYERIRKVNPNVPMHPHFVFDTNVQVLTVFPGIQESAVKCALHTPGLKAVILKTYGSGNAPQKKWFVDLLKDATRRGIVIVNISQCQAGTVDMARYETGLHLLEAGVISGYDATMESVLTKLMFLIGHDLTPREIRVEMTRSLAGEFTKVSL